MKKITLEVSDANYAIVEEAFTKHYGYEPTFIKGTVANGQMVREETPNPQSKEDFVVEKIVAYMTSVVQESMLKQKREEAKVQTANSISSLRISKV